MGIPAYRIEMERIGVWRCVGVWFWMVREDGWDKPAEDRGYALTKRRAERQARRSIRRIKDPSRHILIEVQSTDA